MSVPTHDAQSGEKEVPALESVTPAPTKRSKVEVVSSYFTIAAAAAGLISDGCMSRAASRFWLLADIL